MSWRSFILFVLFAGGYTSFSQDQEIQFLQPNRYEIEIKFSDDDFSVISLKEEGLALIREKNKYKSGNRKWELILLDSELQERTNLEIEIDQQKSLTGYEYTPGFLYLLFKAGENTRFELEVTSIQLSNYEIKKFLIKPELPVQLTHFNIVDDNLLFGGYVNSEPAILLHSLTSDNTKVLPGLFQKDTELIDLRPNQNHTFNIVLIDRTDRLNQKIIFKTFDATGIELLADIIPIDENYTIQSGLSSSLIREDLSIIGTWGIRNSKQSNGFYLVPVDPFNDQKIHFTAFGQLDNYLDNLNPKKAKKIKTKTKEELASRQIPNFTSHVMPYRVEEHPDGFILLAEAYSPTSSGSRYPDSYYGNPYFTSPYYGYYPSTYNRFYNRGYYNDPGNTRINNETRISLSALVAFDENGNWLWDYSMELEDIRTNGLEQVADFCILGNKIYFVYRNESKLMVKTITLGTEEITESIEDVKLKFETDELRSQEKTIGEVRFWFRDSFYVWGKQSIRDNAKRNEGTRQVFYVNKLVAN